MSTTDPVRDPVRGWAFEHYGFEDRPARGRHADGTSVASARTTSRGESGARPHRLTGRVGRRAGTALAASALLLTAGAGAAVGAGLDGDGLMDLVERDGGGDGGGGGR